MVSIRDPYLGPGLSRTHTKLTSGRGTISAPRPCVNVLRQRAPFRPFRQCCSTRARLAQRARPRRATTQKHSRRLAAAADIAAGIDLALREPALRCSIPACPTQANCGDTAAVKSSYLSAQRHRDANTTGVATCLDPLRGLTCCCCCCDYCSGCFYSLCYSCCC